MSPGIEPKYDREDVLKRYRKLLNYAAVAEELGCSRQMVHTYVKAAGLKTPKDYLKERDEKLFKDARKNPDLNFLSEKYDLTPDRIRVKLKNEGIEIPPAPPKQYAVDLRGPTNKKRDDKIEHDYRVEGLSRHELVKKYKITKSALDKILNVRRARKRPLTEEELQENRTYYEMYYQYHENEVPISGIREMYGLNQDQAWHALHIGQHIFNTTPANRKRITGMNLQDLQAAIDTDKP